MPCLMCVFVYKFVCFVYLYLFIESFIQSFIYLCIYFIYLFIRSFHCSLNNLLIDWFNGWLLISSPINTELINSTKEKSALGRPSGRCEGNNKIEVRIGYMQVWTGYNWLI